MFTEIPQSIYNVKKIQSILIAKRHKKSYLKVKTSAYSYTISNKG